MSGFAARLLGAARLDTATFEEIEHDERALAQACGVVLLAGAATGVAQLPDGHVVGAVAGAALAVVGWAVWAGIVWVLGVRLMPESATEADAAQLLRTLGFAAAPGMLRVVGVVPSLAFAADVVASVWTIAAMVVAVRQVLDYAGTGRAVAVCVIGWSAQLLVLVAVGMLVFGPDVGAKAPEPGGTQSAGAAGIVRPSALVPPTD